MDALLFLLGLIVLVAPVVSLVVVARQGARLRRLEGELHALRDVLPSLSGSAQARARETPAESTNAAAAANVAAAPERSPSAPSAPGPDSSKPASVPTHTVRAVPDTSNVAAPEAREQQPTATAREAEPAPDQTGAREQLERFLGGRVLLVVGVIVVLFALGFFLKIAIDRGWLSPGLRLTAGVSLGVLALFGGDRLRARGLVEFGHGLMGAGLGALYLSTWFASARYGFLERPAAFVCLAAVTLLGGGLAVWRRAALLAWLGFLGAYLAPGLLGQGQGALVPLTTWLCGAHLGLAAVLCLRHWQGLELMALAASCGYGVLWFGSWYEPGLRGTASACFALQTVALLALSLGPALLRGRRLTLPALSAAGLAGLAAALAGHALLYETGRRSFGLALLVLALVFIVASCVQLRRVPDARPEGEALLAFALAALACALPVLLQGRALPPAWAFTGLGLVLVSRRSESDVARAGGLLLIALASVAVLLLGPDRAPDAGWPLLNASFLSALSPALALALAARALTGDERPGELVLLLGQAAVALATWVLAWEVSGAWVEHVAASGAEWSPATAAQGRLLAALALAAWGCGLAWFQHNRSRRELAGPTAAPTSATGAPSDAVTSGPPPRGLGTLSMIPLAVAPALALSGVPGHAEPFTWGLNALFASGLATVVLLLLAIRALASTPARVVGVAALVLGLALLAGEWWQHGTLRPLADGLTREQALWTAQLGISGCWALVAVTLVALGLRGGHSGWRWMGLAVFALTLGKVFLVDMASLDPISRVGSFLALGVLLVGASYLYNRALRGEASPGA